MLLDRVEIALLGDALRHDLALAGGLASRPQEVVGQLDGVVLGDELRRGLHVALREAIAAAHQAGQLVEHLLGARDVRGLPLHDQLLAGRADADAKLRFQLFEVLVVGAEQGLSPFVGDLNLAHHGSWNGDNPFYGSELLLKA